MSSKDEKYVISFEHEAQRNADGTVVIRDFGVQLVSENAGISPLFLEVGKRYRVTVEEME